MGIPVALEVGNQRRAETAIGLVARIGRAVAAEQVERLLSDPEGATIADRADRAGVGEAIDQPCQSGVHLVGPRDLVTDQPALRAVADKLALILDRLARDPVAGEAR